ncbi:MAG TPA: hypothetical protein VL986_02460 [Terracidiphilus sp.]|nr:hypothetical protein [Terracidiphilus sp.]
MEVTCTRCHQPIDENATYCASCGLPQLLYQAETGAGAAQPERRQEPVRDAASIAWKPAMSAAARLGVPAGIIFAVCNLYSFIYNSNLAGLMFLMGAAAAWVVAIYVRNQKPAWLTIGAGARIGLVTGIFSAWASAATCGLILYGARYWFRSGQIVDASWSRTVNDEFTQIADIWSSIGIDAHTSALLKAKMITPGGQAEGFLSMTSQFAAGLLLFSVAGGALGARFLARPRRPEA